MCSFGVHLYITSSIRFNFQKSARLELLSMKDVIINKMKLEKAVICHNKNSECNILDNQKPEVTTVWDEKTCGNKKDEELSEAISIKERCKLFMSETSFTAITKIHTAGSVGKKIIWLLLVLAMLGWLTVQCYWLFHKYLMYPVEVRLGTVSVSKITFPSVTVCNKNPLKYSQVNQSDSPFYIMLPYLELKTNDLLYNKALEMLQNSYYANMTNATDGANVDWTAIMIENKFSMWDALQDPETREEYYQSPQEKFKPTFHYAKIASEINDAELRKYGHEIDDFLMSCSFDGMLCSPENFTYMQSRVFGNCYTFNSFKDVNPAVVSTQAGALFGLHLELNVEQMEYINSLAPDSGVVISIHERGIHPFPEDDGISLSPGTSTFIGLKKVHIQRLPPPHANCSHTPNRNDWYMQKYGVNYDTRACTKSCHQSLLADNCNCSVPYTIMPPGALTCNLSSSTVVQCMQGVLDEFDICSQECPDSCLETKYEKFASMSQWPSEKYEEYLDEKTRKTNSDFMDDEVSSDDNLVKVQVYFEELSIRDIEQQKAYENLISDVGGQLGLWLGLSAITIGEIMEFLGAVFKTMTKKIIKKRQRVDTATPVTAVNN